jgi:hypothetical protein
MERNYIFSRPLFIKNRCFFVKTTRSTKLLPCRIIKIKRAFVKLKRRFIRTKQRFRKMKQPFILSKQYIVNQKHSNKYKKGHFNTPKRRDATI